MKKLYFLFFTLLSFASFGQSTLPYYEPFNYTVSSNLGGQGNWVNFFAGDEVLVNSGNLNYTGLQASIGNSVTFSANGFDPQQTITSQSTGIVYCSFIFKVTDLTTLTIADGGYFLGLAQTSSSFATTVWLKTNGVGFQIGINKSTGITDTQYLPTIYDINTEYFVVIAYDLGATKTASIWVNPSSSDLGIANAPVATLNTTAGTTDRTSIDRVFLRQDSTTETPTIVLDELRVGLSWADVTPSTSTSPKITVSGPLTGMNYITGNGPSNEKSFTVSGSNLTEDISVTAPANFEISNTSGGTFGSSLSLRQTAGSVASTTLFVRLMAGMPIAEHTGNITLTSNGADSKSVSVTGNVFPALTNALVITGVFDGNATASTPRGIELMVLKDIPDLSIFGIESANNGGGALGQEFPFPAVAATKGQTIFIVGTGHEADFTSYFGAGFVADYASDALFINGNDAIVLYENTFMIDLFGEVTHAVLISPFTGLAWNYENGWGYRNADTGPSSTFTVADWQLGNAGELDQPTNAASSTPYPIKSYSNVLGISKQQLKDGFALYPNPVRGGTVSIQSKSNSVKNITIFDVVGKQVYQKTTSASQINISQLKTGMYFVKVVQDGKIATRKLVVQ